MGLGISDEVLEKILAEPWTSCASDYYTPTPNAPTYRSPCRTSYVPQRVPVKPIADIAPVTSKTAAKEVDKNLLFLFSIYHQIKLLYSDIELFWSEEYKTVVTQVYEYFSNIVELHSIEVVTIPNNELKKAQTYLFDGFGECIYYYLTHNTLTKPKLRNIVEDTLRLARRWNMFEMDEGTASKRIFFEYYIKRYGLSRNEYHCCPHCGSYIIQGVYNCPNCYAQTDIAPTQKKRLISTVDESDNTTVDDENSKLQARLQESDEEVKRAREENVDLQRENERLRLELEGKNVAIKAMTQFIYENGNVETGKKKILIIGDIPLNLQEVFELSSQIGINPEMLDILDDFSKIKKVAGRIKNDDKYAGIIIGAVPHKVSKLGDASSLSTLFRGSGYPFLVEARTYQGELKITKESLKRAMTDMMFHLLSMGLI